MDNPFAIGDLVHIPKGVMLYEAAADYAIPEKAVSDVAVGLIMRKQLGDFYSVSIGQNEYLIKKEDMTLITTKGKR
jgi:phage terminase large subunit-like protein